jgi:hypothetical protein
MDSRPEGLSILNMDATLQYELHCLGASYVLHDHLGSFLVAASRWSFDRVDSPNWMKLWQFGSSNFVWSWNQIREGCLSVWLLVTHQKCQLFILDRTFVTESSFIITLLFMSTVLVIWRFILSPRRRCVGRRDAGAVLVTIPYQTMCYKSVNLWYTSVYALKLVTFCEHRGRITSIYCAEWQLIFCAFALLIFQLSLQRTSKFLIFNKGNILIPSIYHIYPLQ